MTEVIVHPDERDHDIITPSSSTQIPLSPGLEDYSQNELASDLVGNEEETQCMVECGCCYTDSNVAEMVQCSECHLFCFDCMNRYAEEAIHGQGKSTLLCMATDCDASFPRSQMERALSDSILQKFDERIQQESLSMADLPNLVRCPGCNYAAEIVEDNQQVFICPNCEKLTCRHCQVDWDEHQGLTCSQVEKQDETKLRTKYEERMTKAKIRECPRCKAPLVKDGGCNKVTCRCGGVICYICRKPEIQYTHFCQHTGPHPDGCKTCSLCLLWTNAEEDDKRAIQQLKLEGKTERITKGFSDDKDIGAPEEEQLPGRRVLSSKRKQPRQRHRAEQARRAVEDARQVLQVVDNDELRPPYGYPHMAPQYQERPQMARPVVGHLPPRSHDPMGGFASDLNLLPGQRKMQRHAPMPAPFYTAPMFVPNDRFLPNKMVVRQAGQATNADIGEARASDAMNASRHFPPHDLAMYGQAPAFGTRGPLSVPGPYVPHTGPSTPFLFPAHGTHGPLPVPSTHVPPLTHDTQVELPITAAQVSSAIVVTDVPALVSTAPSKSTASSASTSASSSSATASTSTAAAANQANDFAYGEGAVGFSNFRNDGALGVPGAEEDSYYPDDVIVSLSLLLEEEQVKSRQLEETFNLKMEQLIQKTNTQRQRLTEYFEEKRRRLKRPYRY
ncbi:E3 ubiquitin-protein ligase RNF216-like isoform X2 [Watersipora subatra]|uniref:E3 ubiquitin-protein ligase RNF216-like isoform X2 n=1 Tax=Watersipora subatra TaxID=2589382 RepID=UPI00355B8545